MARRNFVAPDGSVYSIEDTDQPLEGWRPETPEDIAGESPGQAGLEGFARSATFGLSDQVAQTLPLDGMDTEQLRLRKEANPNAALAGEVAGMFTPGPAAAIGLGAKATAATGSRLVGGAVEGGLFGLGQSISEDAIGDPKLAGDGIAAGVFGGALMGAGMNPVFGKVGDLGRSALIKAFGGKAITSELATLAENSIMRSVTNPSDLGKKSLRGRANEVGRFALDEKFASGAPSFATASERAGARAKDAWTGIENALVSADSIGPFDAGRAAAVFSNHAQQLAHNPAMADVRVKLNEIAGAFLDARTRPDSFAKAWETSSSLLDQVGPMQAKGFKRELFKARGSFQEDIFQQVAKLDPQLSEQLKKSNRDYANSATFRDLAMKKADQVEFGSSFGGLPGMMAGVGAVAAAGPVGLVAPFAMKIARERGGFIMGSALDALAQSGALPKIANGFRTTMRAKLGMIPTFGGAFRATLETAAAEGSMELLQTHLSLSSDPEYMMSVGLEHEEPGAVAGYADKAHRLGQLSNAVDASGAEIDRAIGRVLGEQGGPVPKRTKRATDRAEYESVKRKLKELTADENRLSKQLSELAPMTAGIAQMQIAAGARYLLDHAPKDPNEGLPPALHRLWEPSKSELRAWYRRVDTVADPRAVLEAMQEGLVTPEAIETLQLVYPRLHQEFQDRMMARLAAWDEPLDHKRRAQISYLIGDLGDPAVTQLIQATHAATTPPAGVSGPDGREKIDVEKNQQTQAQRLEGKD